MQTLRWGEFGFALYSNGLLVSDAMIASNPALVKGFVAATMRGFAATFADLDAGVATMVRLHPALDPAIVRAEIEIVRDMAMTDHAKRNGIGWIDQATMQKTADAVRSVFKVEKPPVADLYSNDFISQIAVLRSSYDSGRSCAAHGVQTRNRHGATIASALHR